VVKGTFTSIFVNC